MEGVGKIMSKFVDERVVEMSFENKKFEKNVKTSMGTIDELKNSLDFSGAANTINEQLNGVNANGLTSAIMSVKQGFTAFEVSSITAIANITNRLIDMGISMVKVLSTDNIGEGWTKFGQIAISEATLLAQGIETYDGEITDILAKLTWYADETSYSLTDMVDNMSKFTASGRTLDESANAMMGIANWAALAGQNSQKASTAMYQLSQALGKGSVRWADYRSIVNANMDMKEFRKKALETGVLLGELTQDVDGMYTSMDGRTFGADQFTDSLTSQWFTSDVLLRVLNEYADGANKIYELIQQDDDINTATDAIKKYGDTIDAFSLKAFLAAQEARTFRDTIMAVQDAVSSGYMMIFTQMFGNVAEAKVLWTNLANELYNVFTKGIWKKIDVLSLWADLGGRDDLFASTEDNTGAFWNLFNAMVAIKDLIAGAWRDVFGLSDLEDYDDQVVDIAHQLKRLTERIKEFTSWLFLNKKATEDVTNIFRGLFSVFKIIGKVVIAVAKGFAPLLAVFGVLGGQTDVLGFLGDLGYQLYMFAESDAPFDAITASITRFFDYLISTYKDVKNYFDLLNSDNKWAKLAGRSIEQLTPLAQFLIPIIINLTTAFNWLKDKLVNNVYPALLKIGGFFVWFGPAIWDVMKKTGALISQWINWIQTNEKIQNGFIKLKEVLADIGAAFLIAYEAVKKFFESFSKKDTQEFEAVPENVEKSLTPLQNFIKGLVTLLEGFWAVLKAVASTVGEIFFYIGNVLSVIGTKLKEIFTGSDGALNFAKIFNMTFWAAVILGIYRFADMLRSVTAVFRDAFDSMFDYFNSKALEQYMNTIRNMAISILMMVGALLILASMDAAALKKSMIAMTALVSFIVGAIWLMKTLAAVTSSVSKSGSLFKGIKDIKSEYYNLYGVAAAFMAIGAAILLLTFSLKMISNMEPVAILKGLAVIALMLVMIISVMKLVAEKKDDERAVNKTVKSMVKVALAIALLVRPLKIIGNIDSETSKRGLINIGVLMGILALYSRFSKSISKSERAIHSSIAMAVALTILLIPLNVIGNMADETIIRALTTMLGVFLVLVLINKVLDKQLTKARMQNMATMMWSLIPFAIGMTLFAGALLALGSLRMTTVGKALLTMVGIFGILVIVNKVLTNKLTKPRMKNMTRMMFMLYPMAGAMMAFTFVLLGLGSIPLVKLAKSLGTMAAIFGMIVVINKVSKNQLTKPRMKNMTRMMFALMPMAVGMAALGVSLAFLGSMKWETIIKGLGLFTSMLVLLGAMSYVANYFGATLALAALGFSLVPLAYGIMAITAAVTAVGLLPFEAIKKGLLSIAAIFVVLTVLGYIIQPVVPALLGVAATFFLFAAAMGILAASLAAVVTVVSVSGIAFAGALLAMAAATLAAVPMFMAALWVFVEGLALIIKKAIPLIIDNIVLFFTKILIAFVTVIPLLIETLVTLTRAITTAMVDVFPEVVTALLTLMDILFTALYQKLPALVSTWIDYFIAMMEMITTRIPDIEPSISKFMVAFVKAMVDHTITMLPVLIDAGYDLILALLEGIGNAVVEKAPEFRKAVDVFCSQIWEGMKSFFKIGEAATKMGELVGFLIGGLKASFNGGTVGLALYIAEWAADVFEPLITEAKTAGKDLVNKIKDGISDAWESNKSWFSEKADKLLLAFKFTTLILKAVGKNFLDNIKEGASDAWEVVNTWFSEKAAAILLLFSALSSKFKTQGEDMLYNLKLGAIIGWIAVNVWFTNKVAAIGEFFGIDTLKQAGIDIMKGLAQGVIEGWNAIPELVAELGDGFVTLWNDMWGIESPSKVFAEIGKYVDLGLAKGISDNTDAIHKATREVGDEASDGLESSGLSKVLQDLNKSLEADFENEVVIRPVMDLSEIQNGKNMLLSMMKEFDGYGIAGSNSIAGSARDQINKVVAANRSNNPSSTVEGNDTSGTINNTFNIQGSNPKEIAAEVSKVLQIQVNRRNAKWAL